MNLTKGLLLACGLLLLVFLLKRYRGDVDGATARQLVSEGALLLDVRSRAEYQENHLEGAVNIPVQELDQRLSELGEKVRPIVVYCRSGNRSARATSLLRSNGFAEVKDLGAMSRY